MNYCHPCQRHLNGALACPGCGTPAERIAVPAEAHGYEQGYGYEQGFGYEQGYATTGSPVPDATPPGPAEEESSYPGDGHSDDEGPVVRGARGSRRAGAGAGAGAGTGAGRRDRKAAAHRRRRRRAVLIASGFVLAAGGLSLAELGRDAPFSGLSGGAATAGDTVADGDTASAAPDRTADPLDATSGGAGTGASVSPDASATGSAHASASVSAEGTDPASPSAKDARTAVQSASTGSGTAVTSPAAPAPTRPAATPSSAPAASAPAPRPSPSRTRTCNRFLWWCT